MKIKANNIEIPVLGVMSDSIRQEGKKYPALKIVFSAGVTEEQLNALCSGKIEILGNGGDVIGVHEGYTTKKELTFVVAKIETAEQQRDDLAAALAIEEAKKPYIEKLTKDLDDATASTVTVLFPSLEGDGKLISAGTRINWNGALKRAAVDLWDRTYCDPDNAPDMWEDILYRDGYRIIPETITVGLAFSNGERGWWGDTLYESLSDNNVYTPEQHADWWKVVE